MLPQVPPAARTYRVQQFAALAGVTVKTLHHYDRLGLLRPERTAAGYRVYSDDDLQRLAQITALKLVGVPLKGIAPLLGTSPTSAAGRDLGRCLTALTREELGDDAELIEDLKRFWKRRDKWPEAVVAFVAST
jgi:DNA-binding transcriptional MerR regulator